MKNFCSNYGNDNIFPRIGLVAIDSIIRKTGPVGDTQKVLLLHASKAFFKKGVDDAASFFVSAESMIMSSEVTDSLCTWKSLAKKVTHHPQVKPHFISFLAEKTKFVLKIIQLIDEYIIKNNVTTALPELENIEIIFVHNNRFTLRGFAGVNKIYINATHFTQKIHVCEPQMKSSDKFHNAVHAIIEFDICVLSLHELAHVRIRQVKRLLFCVDCN